MHQAAYMNANKLPSACGSALHCNFQYCASPYVDALHCAMHAGLALQSCHNVMHSLVLHASRSRFGFLFSKGKKLQTITYKTKKKP